MATQWDRLQEMRQAREGEGTPVLVKDDQPRAADGTFVKKDDEAAVTAAAAAEAEKSKIAANAAAAEAKKHQDDDEAAKVAAAAAEAVKTAVPQSVEIEIDGQKVLVDPSLADAFKKAETVQKDAVKATERETLKAEVKAEVLAEVKTQLPPEKSAAEKAADEALAAAEAAAKLPKKPDAQLLISNPDEWTKQQDVYEEARIKAASEKTRADVLNEIQKRDQVAVAATEKQAREIVREQFYVAYPVLRDSASVVDGLLTKKMDDLIASGKLNKPFTPAEREALKAQEFADVATKATREIAKVMHAGKKVIPPAAPPAVVSSAPAKSPSQEKPTTEEPKAKTKFPPGSLSATLAERRARMSA